MTGSSTTRLFVFAAIIGPPAFSTAMAAAQPSDTPDRTDAAAAARRFIATLDDAARDAVVFPFDAAERRRWRRDPGPRPGLAVKDMSEVQRELIDRLLGTVLSDTGRRIVEAVRREQDLLARDEGGLGNGYYWFAIYGEPGEAHWAWRLSGHHVSLHVTYAGEVIRSVTPIHLGGEIAGPAEDDWSGYKALHMRETLARQITAGCDEPQLRRMRIAGEAPRDMIISEGGGRAGGDEGLPLSAMSAEQRAAVDRLVGEYLSVFSEPIARALAPDLGQYADRFRFAWSGSREEGQPHYYRLQSPGFLIEYVNAGAHLHTIVSTDGDWGRPESPP